MANRHFLQTFDRFRVGGNILEIEIVAGIHAESDFPREARGLAMRREYLQTRGRAESVRVRPGV